MTHIPLAQAIEDLRKQLGQAIIGAHKEPLQFKVKEIHLELNVAVTASEEGTAQVGLWNVLTLGGKGDHSNVTTHTLSLTLIPHLKDDPPDVGIDVTDTGPQPLE
ncbi:MAG TPA: trypco2 family protein [Ktedonobacteraceae bacterium]|nr:trypco2 family protein [Ktedonobacteraceae bacterium]